MGICGVASAIARQTDEAMAPAIGPAIPTSASSRAFCGICFIVTAETIAVGMNQVSAEYLIERGTKSRKSCREIPISTVDENHDGKMSEIALDSPIQCIDD